MPREIPALTDDTNLTDLFTLLTKRFGEVQADLTEPLTARRPASGRRSCSSSTSTRTCTTRA
jgi:hypothetical protein